MSIYFCLWLLFLYKGTLASTKFTKFLQYVDLGGFTCQAAQTIFDEKVGSLAKCVLKCYDATMCYGVFYQPQKLNCVGCEEPFFTGDVALLLNGTRYYRRQTYKVIEEKMYWDEGQKVCEILGGRLADIKTQAEEEFLERYVFPGYSRNFWLGATDFKNLGTYLWLDGTKVSDFYVKWSPRQPNREDEHCVIASNLDGWGWRDTDCQSKQFSLCEFY